MKDAILSLLPQSFCWRDRIHWFDCTDSTNTQAKHLAAAGAPHGTVLIAGRQTGGRGRMGRSFDSPGEMGLYLSAILRPDCHAQELMHLTCAAAVAMCDAVAQAVGLRPGIKWINDLVIGSKKLGGILTELSLAPQSGKVAYAVIGIGINCCQGLRDFPPQLQNMATSLFLATGQRPNLAAVAASVIRGLFRMDQSLLSEKVAMMHAYRQNCVTLGREITVLREDRCRSATALDVDDDGALLVVYADGTRETVSSGEVSVRGMYGYV